MCNTSNVLDQKALRKFREYLQIPSVHPNVNYEHCVEFLERFANELELPYKVHIVSEGKPVVVITLPGTHSDLSSIFVNSHMDVVPVFEEKWTYKPFGAEIINGRIYARGSQDMKCVGIQYLEAIRRLKLRNISLKRTLHVCFVPEEEIGGLDGMKKFVDMQEFRDLNIGFAMDEGLTNQTEDFILFYGERYGWKMYFHCSGNSGHASLMQPNVAAEKVLFIINKISELRKREMRKLEQENMIASDVTSINVTLLNGGVQLNVVPAEFIVGVDCRIPPSVDEKFLEETFNQWCKDAGDGISLEFICKETKVEPTLLSDSNLFWLAVRKAFDEAGINVKPQISPATSDAKFLREAGIPVIGFSPINNTPVLIHDNDEYLGVDTFLSGIEIYCKIFCKLCNA